MLHEYLSEKKKDETNSVINLMEQDREKKKQKKVLRIT